MSETQIPPTPDSPESQPPKRKRKPNTNLALRPTPANERAPGWLPPEIRAQPLMAHLAFAMLVAKPTRSLRSIARDLSTANSTLQRLADAGRWRFHLGHILNRTPEMLAIQAKQEAQRSRADMLASNRLAEGLIEGAMIGMAEVDADGNVSLRPGYDLGDLMKLGNARHTHIKSTHLLTGEDAAQKRSAAAAGAAKITINTRDWKLDETPATGRVVDEQ